jgi:hypothetical protein
VVGNNFGLIDDDFKPCSYPTFMGGSKKTWRLTKQEIVT